MSLTGAVVVTTAGAAIYGTGVGARVIVEEWSRQAAEIYSAAHPTESLANNYRWDAFLHSYVAGRFSQLVTPDVAIAIMNAREAVQSINHPADSAMDSANNTYAANAYHGDTMLPWDEADYGLGSKIEGDLYDPLNNPTGPIVTHPDQIVSPEPVDMGTATSGALDELANQGLNIFGDLSGYVDDLSASSALRQISAFGSAVTSLFASAFGIISPLVFDLDDSGTIDLTSLAGSTTYWDIDNDGFAEHSGWVTGGDGLLAIDLNDNGRIDNHAELFGTATIDGFSVLSQYDDNHDGLITSEDAVFSDLIMWIDVNENGYSEETELYSLSDLNIISINLNATAVNQANEGHTVTHTSSFTVDTGGGLDTRAVHDVWFQYDNVNSVGVVEFEADVRAAFLPDLRGYGVLNDLRVAMSLDNSGSGNLLGLVQALAFEAIDDIFADSTSVLDEVKNILFRWAGVDDVSPTSRGPNIDARELEFLEKFNGQDFLQRGAYPDPYYYAAQPLKEAFQIALDNFAARLITQAVGHELFTGDFYYDIASDSFDGITGLNLTTLDDLETLAGSQTNKDVFWENVVRVIDNTIGVTNLSSGDETALNSAIYDSDNALSLSIILDALVWDNGTVTTWNGTSGDDTYTGGAGMDTLNGGNGNDTLNGSTGADRINGEAGNDILDGQGGDDYLQGGTGNDTYKYAAGNGWDTFEEYGSDTGDKILFASGITLGDLTISRVSNYDMLIEIASGVGGGRILVSNQFNTTTQIETLEIAGGSTFNLLTQNWTLHGTDQADTLWGVGNGGSGIDTIYGGNGDDVIYAYAPNQASSTQANWLYGEVGNDTLYGGAGADTLSGGDGNDNAWGGSGNDIYIYESGNDVYHEGVSGTDEIQLDTGIVQADVNWERGVGTDLIITIDGRGSITIDDFFTSSAYKIETLRFADTSTIDLSGLVYGTSGNDSLFGTSGADMAIGFGGNDTIYTYAGADTIHGNEGNDTIVAGDDNDLVYGDDGNDSLDGGAGADTLDGGAGDDTVYGGAGNDIYIYESGDDTFIEGTASTDEIHLAEGITSGDVLYYRQGSYDLVIQVDGLGSIRLDDFYYSSAYKIENLVFADTTTVDLTALAVSLYYGTSGNDSISGTNGVNDTIYGFGGNDNLYGYSGDDSLYGGDGNDNLYAYGLGNDLYDGGAGNDYMEDTYGGNDVYVYSGGLDIAYDYSGTDILRLSGPTTINDLTFSDLGYHHKITVNAGVDEIQLYWVDYSTDYQIETIEFADGFSTTLPNWASWTVGTSSGETLNGGAGNDTIVGKGGDDTVSGNNGNDAIHGGAGNDTLDGGAGTDLLHGGVGSDTLNGGDGVDTLYGGDGADTFVFDANAFNNVDNVKDFSVAQEDALDISDILSGYDAGVDDINDWLTLTNSGGNTQVFVDRDGSGGTYSSQQVALLYGVTDLDPDDLLANGNLIAA